MNLFWSFLSAPEAEGRQPQSVEAYLDPVQKGFGDLSVRQEVPRPERGALQHVTRCQPLGGRDAAGSWGCTDGSSPQSGRKHLCDSCLLEPG